MRATKNTKELPVRAIAIGCGHRGLNVYGAYAKANPKNIKFVGCFDINEKKARKFAEIHNIPTEFVFYSEEMLFKVPKFADAVIICTPDPFHESATIKALEKGYHVFLEKPMAISKEGCENILKVAEKNNSILMIGFVLRYAPVFSKINELIKAGSIGDVVSIKHSENMGFWVYSHSFARSPVYTQSPMILQKGSHDFDLIYWYANARPKFVSSFKMPNLSATAKLPDNVTERCIEKCPLSKQCIFDAVQMYLEGKFMLLDNSRAESRVIRFIFKFALKHPKLARILIPPLRSMKIVPWRQWPVDQITEDVSDDGIRKALEETPFGVCIYKIKDAQPISQITSIQFENGITASFTLHGLSYRDGREIRIDGTKGTIKGYFYNTGFYVDWFEHATGKEIRFKYPLEKVAGGGGDFKIMDDFVDCIKHNKKPLTSAKESLYSHLMAFAAHESSETGKTIEIK